MKTSKHPCWLYLVVAPFLALLLVFGFMNGFVQASKQDEAEPAPAPADRDPVEVFSNDWSYSTFGLVYSPLSDSVFYAHESQSSKHRPTIYEIEYQDSQINTPTVKSSFALSTVNSGWPWQIDNRDGAGYDYVEGTFFLPDYNGDLSYADDNIVEITPDGTILNAWEMDNEVGSNDSSDGSKIDNIIDIAVVPGEPTRYFAAAAYDGNVVYEISLTKTGTWWTPNSWHTVATYSVPTWDANNDNLAIDYDSENGLLYHSSWDTTTIVITDLGMNLAPAPFLPFDCPGAGGYNSGVTYIEGSDPPEVWVTDFSSDKTTRCQLPPPPIPEPGWSKSVDGETWVPGLEITKETLDTFLVTEVITAGVPFTQTEIWDEARLQIADVIVDPPLAEVEMSPGLLLIKGNEATPETITVEKTFLVQPSTWTETTVNEILDIQDSFYEERPFTINKRAPQLTISSDYVPDVYAGSMARLTLNFGNEGGYENDIAITNTFPITAPLIYAVPTPDAKALDGTWARWDLGDLQDGDHGSIDVYIYIPETASVGDQITVWDGIYNHVGELADEVATTFTVQSKATLGWTKTIEGVSWTPGISITKQTSETFTVVDVINVSGLFLLTEEWFPPHLELVDWEVDGPGSVYVGDGLLTLQPTFPTRPITLTKVFRVEPCSWPETILWEQLSSIGSLFTARPVLVNKELPILDIESLNPTPEIYGGETLEFTLNYSNTGGFENAFLVSSEFPAEISFVSSIPAQTAGDPGDPVIDWEFPAGLTKGETGSIAVTVQVADEVPPGEVYEVLNTLFNHAGEQQDSTTVHYAVPEPVWAKAVNGEPWSLTQRTVVEVGDIVTVTEVITTQAAFELVDTWDARYLALIDTAASDGTVNEAPGQMSWEVPSTAPEVVSLTKHFEVIEAFTSTQIVVWENLYTGGVEWDRRPVILERPMPDLRLLKSVAPVAAAPGDVITYTLAFSNAGPGTASGVVITDHVPSSILVTGIISSGVQITDTGASPAYVWQVADLAENQGGVIVIVGILGDLPPGSIVENLAEIFADNLLVEDDGTTPGGNPPARITSEAYLTVEMRLYLPLVLR